MKIIESGGESENERQHHGSSMAWRKRGENMKISSEKLAAIMKSGKHGSEEINGGEMAWRK